MRITLNTCEQNFGNTSGCRSDDALRGRSLQGHMTCFWMPGTNSLALGFRLLLICRDEEVDFSVLLRLRVHESLAGY